MAMIDLRNCFTYTYSLGTAADLYAAFTAGMLATNNINLDVAGLKLGGAAKPPWLIVKVGTIFAGNTGGAQIKLITDSVDPVFDAGTAKDVLVYRFAMGVMIAKALLINQPLPHFEYLQFLGLEFEPHTADASGGTLCAFLSDGPEPAETAPAMTVEDGYS